MLQGRVTELRKYLCTACALVTDRGPAPGPFACLVRIEAGLLEIEAGLELDLRVPLRNGLSAAGPMGLCVYKGGDHVLVDPSEAGLLLLKPSYAISGEGWAPEPTAVPPSAPWRVQAGSFQCTTSGLALQ